MTGRHSWEELPTGSDGATEGQEDEETWPRVAEQDGEQDVHWEPLKRFWDELEEEAADEAARRARADQVLARIAETLEARRRHRKQALYAALAAAPLLLLVVAWKLR